MSSKNDEVDGKKRLKSEQAKEVISNKSSDTQDVTVYDVPLDVWNRFVSLAKLYYDNEGWKVLRDALVALTEKYEKEEFASQKDMERVEKRIDGLKNYVEDLEGRIKVMQQFDSDEDKNINRETPSFEEAREMAEQHKEGGDSGDFDEEEFEELKSLKD